MNRTAAQLVALAFLCGCGNTPEAAPYADPGPAVCEGGPQAPTADIERRLGVVGPSVNGMRRFGDDIYVVVSGSNTIDRLDPVSGTTVPLVDVGNDHSPWDVWATDDELWITNFIAGTVTVADRTTGEVLDEIRHESFEGPAGIAATKDRVYVGNTQFRGSSDYGNGSVTVIDRASRTVIGTVPTERKNPQNIDILELADGPRVIVVDGGAIAFDGGQAYAGSEGAVELWTETEEPLEPQRRAAILGLRDDDRRIGLPGRPLVAPGSKTIYLASATAPVLFRLDTGTMEFARGSDDPIAFGAREGDSLNHAAIDARGIIYLAAFNEDAMYLIDTACDSVLRGPLALDDSSRLAGPLGAIPVNVDDGRVDVFFVLSLANEIGRVRMRYE